MPQELPTWLQNSMADIKEFFDDPKHPLQDGEFKDFWLSLTKEERDEFRNTPLK
jgi:hypothetical protein